MDITAKADFTKATGKIRPALHSSGWTPRSYPRAIQTDDDAVAIEARLAHHFSDGDIARAGALVYDKLGEICTAGHNVPVSVQA